MTLPYVLCAEVVPLFAWIPSGDNPADDPTRHVTLRVASEVGPELEQRLRAVPESEPWPWDATRLNWKRK
eukprot:6473116-Amphidinium_carterae.2